MNSIGFYLKSTLIFSNPISGLIEGFFPTKGFMSINKFFFSSSSLRLSLLCLMHKYGTFLVVSLTPGYC
jgi:hypothetical protein